MSTPARHSDSESSPLPPFSLFLLHLHGDATPPAKATRVTHSAHYAARAASGCLLKMTLILCVHVCTKPPCRPPRLPRRKKKSRRVLRRRCPRGQNQIPRDSAVSSAGVVRLAVKSPPPSKRGETRSRKEHSLQVEFRRLTDRLVAVIWAPSGTNVRQRDRRKARSLPSRSRGRRFSSARKRVRFSAAPSTTSGASCLYLLISRDFVSAAAQ